MSGYFDRDPEFDVGPDPALRVASSALRDRMLSAATSFVSSRLFLESRMPGPDDDAELEMKETILEHAARDYVESLE